MVDDIPSTCGEHRTANIVMMTGGGHQASGLCQLYNPNAAIVACSLIQVPHPLSALWAQSIGNASQRRNALMVVVLFYFPTHG